MADEDPRETCPHHLGWLRFENRGAGVRGGMIRCGGCKKIWHCCPGTEFFLLHFQSQVEELRGEVKILEGEVERLRGLVMAEESCVTVSQDEGDPVTFGEVSALVEALYHRLLNALGGDEATEV